MEPPGRRHYPSKVGVSGSRGRRRLVTWAQRARRKADLVRHCYAGPAGPAFQAQVMRFLHALLSVDAAFFATADPATLLFAGAIAEDPLAAATGQFLDNEFGHDDVNKFQSLAVSAGHVATLDAATGGHRAGSAGTGT